MKNPIPFLRKIALIEGTSFLVLLFVAMPLKYLWSMPLAVRVVGMIHGMLFLVFCWGLARTWFMARWPMPRVALIFVASIVPFGPWIVDRRFKGYEVAFTTGERFRELQHR
jgi:integral membrane protein